MRWMILLCALMLGGCAKYEFDLIKPEAAAGHIGEEGAKVVDGEGAEFRMRAAEGRLVVWIANKSDEAVELLGTQSYVVDPQGESHPLVGQTIAAGSYVKVILPPMRPVYRAGPSFGIGVGVGVSHYRTRGAGGAHFEDPFYDDPRYFTLVEGADNVYWEWKGEGSIRVRFVFRRGEKDLMDEFEVRRVKVK